MANLPTSIKNLNTLLGEQLTEGGGGGSSWQIVFDGSVTTTASDDHGRAIVAGYDLTANTIKVTFNGTEYTCEFNVETGYGAGDDGDGNFDWTEYPFNIIPREGPEGGVLIISTESTGTYSIKGILGQCFDFLSLRDTGHNTACFV